MASKIKNFFAGNIALFVILGVAALCVAFMCFGTMSENGSITLDGKDAKIEESTEKFIEESKNAMLIYAEEAVPTLITNADGESERIDAQTVLEVESQSPICPEGTECGLGKYIYAPTGTAIEFKDYTINKCWNTDDWAGAQCWDLGDLFWQNYAKRNLNTCGTGAAKGTWDCRVKNAGNEFDLITDKTQLRLGDWVVFNSGKYGHIGMAMGSYNNGYIALLGQNQGGSACSGGGSSTNIINISLNSFAGAFRPKTYEPAPTPTPTPTPAPTPVSNTYKVVKGDTLGQIAYRLGWYRGPKMFGDYGYAQKLAEYNGIKNRGLIYPGQIIKKY